MLQQGSIGGGRVIAFAWRLAVPHRNVSAAYRANFRRLVENLLDHLCGDDPREDSRAETYASPDWEPLELAISDLAIMERRLKKLEISSKAARAAERDAHLKEQFILQKVKAELETDTPIRLQGLAEEELNMLSDYQFLTAKSMLVVLNIGEEQISQTTQLEGEIGSLHPQFAVVAICGKLEMELAQLSDAEASEFREAMGLNQPALDRLVGLSYGLLGLVSFFTTVSSELKAWTIPSGTPAPKAAGKIHSDIERGFIRAEVVSYSDLESCGNIAEARKRGLLRTEGKNYIIQDGDVVTFLFSV